MNKKYIKYMIWDKIIVKHFRDEIDLSNLQYVEDLPDYKRMIIDDLEDEIETLEDKMTEIYEEECKRIEMKI